MVQRDDQHYVQHLGMHGRAYNYTSFRTSRSSSEATVQYRFLRDRRPRRRYEGDTTIRLVDLV
jgi:hypothetical protein